MCFDWWCVFCFYMVALHLIESFFYHVSHGKMWKIKKSDFVLKHISFTFLILF